MTFSSLYEVVCGFTRDYDIIRSRLDEIEEHDATCFETALHGVNHLVLEEWGNNTPCQVIVITDGWIGVGPGCLKHSLATLKNRDTPFPLPFSFPGKLHVVNVVSSDDDSFLAASPYFQRLVDLAGPDGHVRSVDGPVTSPSVTAMFQRLAEDIYTSFKGVLRCGDLTCNVLLSPPPVPYTKVTDFDQRRMTLSNIIEVVGFIQVSDVGSPMAVSRHLVLPVASREPAGPPVVLCKTEPEEEDSTSSDEGKVPSFCVLLHGALKVSNMAALVSVGEDWFGFVFSWADSKKKSNLMLTVLPPGSDAVPWLGDLNDLGTADDLDPNEAPATFPVRPSEKRSYSQNCVVWIKQAGLQSDIQKILRHARKLPDKTTQFYKELNRLRRAAISLGFMELLDGLAYIFDRECTLLPSAAHPDCSMQLAHAANELRKPHIRDIKYTITPMHTKFAPSSVS